jgi:hypothetical protein
MAASCWTLQAWMWSMLLASLSARSRPDRCNGRVGYWNPLNAPAWGADPGHETPGSLVAALLTFPIRCKPRDERFLHQTGSLPDLPRSQGWHWGGRNTVPVILWPADLRFLAV